MRRYRALLVGNWHYPDDPSNLPDLKGPLNDVSHLASALADPAVGLFSPTDVTTLTERASYEIVAELESFFGDATRDDVLFVYYSGHGITADNGSLLLCGRNARTDRRLATTVSSETVNQMIVACPAAAVVIVLDCCHAGAFKAGDLAGDLAGKGRFVLTASRSKDRAPDAESATGLSRFTGHLVRGIRGEAALPGADHVSLSDVYRYVHRRMTDDGPIIPQRRFDGDGEVAIARILGVPPKPLPAAESDSLQISESRIDLGEIREGEILPPERVQVTARAPDGSPATWWAESEADWVFVQARASHADIRITPRVGATRANVHIHNSLTGEIRTIRISVRPLPPAPAVGRSAVPVQPHADASERIPLPSRVPPPGTSVSSPSTVGPPVGTTSPRDLSVPVQVASVPGPSRSEGVGVPAPAAMAEVLVAAMAASPVEQLVVRPASRVRSEIAARKAAGISDHEATVGALDLQGNGFVLFTDRALYWTNQGQAAAVGYRQFPGRQFALSAPTHVDLGDGVPRLIGPRAPALVALLTAIQHRLSTDA